MIFPPSRHSPMSSISQKAISTKLLTGQPTSLLNFMLHGNWHIFYIVSSNLTLFAKGVDIARIWHQNGNWLEKLFNPPSEDRDTSTRKYA